MAKIPFDISKRSQIESGEYKVETFSGYPVTIYRWDFDDGARTPIMGSYVFEDSKEYVGAWNEEGHFDLMSPNDLDLFIITPEPELTDWEIFISGCLQKHGLLDCGAADRIAKECSTELLNLARKEIIDGWNNGLRDTQDLSGKAYSDGYKLGLEEGKAEALRDLPMWRPAAKAYEGDRLPRIDWALNRLVARFEEGIYYLDIKELYNLPNCFEENLPR